MKFDVVGIEIDPAAGPEPGPPSAGPDTASGAASDPPAAHPRLRMAAERMHTQVRTDLATLNQSLGRLRERLERAQAHAPDDYPDARPPSDFRADAFSAGSGRTGH
ncbi:hypothetical protein DFP74_2568 [Nocardiopsis sp. Huas11]|uniref:hypothetical protein n=1 Tax=Nocardiopsis sp. Huas11 TaxID=2183912 RepID=UPI000EB27D0E|nr:hypothetical protein [Nocardiopsis sp. Huas11]RKS06918.1 hypothetical protein DFP74_2568 [Nocardiopsis sp. Huas11]